MPHASPRCFFLRRAAIFLRTEKQRCITSKSIAAPTPTNRELTRRAQFSLCGKGIRAM
jgi:hypothetical protein